MTFRSRSGLPGNWRRFLFVFLVLILFFNGRASTTKASGPDELSWVAYWQLDETGGTVYVDAVGSRDAQCANPNCPTAVTGQSNNGQSFNGSNTALDAAPDPAFDWTGGDSFSIELWVKVDSACATDEVMVGRGSGAAYWSVGCNGSGNVTFQLSDGFATPVNLAGSGSITDGLWHHIVAVRDSSDNSAALYVDGSQAASTTQSFSGSFAAAAAPVNIGYLNGGAYFGGAVDEVALYNGRLPQSAINNHYYIVRNYINACATVEIMPMGNSITRGYGSDGAGSGNETTPSYNHGYRNYLYDSLITGGYDFDFIGRLSHGVDSGFVFDFSHNGFGGDRADQLAGRILAPSFWSFPPDPPQPIPPLLRSDQTPEVILLHIGTNDIAQLQGSSTADVDTILDNIFSFDPNITVILAQIVAQGNDAYDQPFTLPIDPVVIDYNNNLQMLVNNRSDDKIIFVDQFSALDYDTSNPPIDMFDDLHPNESGYNAMAGVWFNELAGFLPDCAAPAISSSGGTALFLGETYTYDVQAAGYPLPTFSLQNAPAGMTIDPATGLISWTPAANQTGQFSFTIVATNSEGTAAQPVTLTVNKLLFLPLIIRQTTN